VKIARRPARVRHLALAVFALGALAAPAHAFVYINDVEVEIPSRALPPGPASAELVASRDARHVIRFSVEDSSAARLRFYRFDYLAESRLAHARSENGTATWQGEAKPESTGGLLFVGSKADHGLLVRSLTSRTESDPQLRQLDGLLVLSAAEALRDGCRRLVDASLVVAVPGPDLPVAALLACVARGAGVVALVPERTAPLDALPVGRPVFWGAGAIAIVDNTEAAVSEAAAMNARRFEWRSPLQEVLLTSPHEEDMAPGGGNAAPAPPHGGRVVVVALACYLALIVAGGIWISRRPRPAWIGWGWFPALAVACALVLVALGRSWARTEAEAVSIEVRVQGPSHGGMALHALRLRTDASAVFALTLPWADDSLLKQVERSHRFGSPFASAVGGLVLREDRIAHRLDVDNLAMNRRDSAGLVWRAPLPVTATPLVQVERRADGGIWLTSRARRPPLRTLLCTRKDLQQQATWSPGKALRFVPDTSTTASRFGLETDPTFRTVRNSLCPQLPHDAFLAMVELDPTEAGAVADPRVTPALPTRRRLIEVDVGPLPPAPSPPEGAP
jgi:hypothetical protein